MTPVVLLPTVKFIMCASKCGVTELSWPPYIQLSNQEHQLNFQSHHSNHLLLQHTIRYHTQKYNICVSGWGSSTLTLSACRGHRVMSPYFLSQEGQRVRPILSSRRVHMHCVLCLVFVGEHKSTWVKRCREKRVKITLKARRTNIFHKADRKISTVCALFQLTHFKGV